MWPKAYRVDTVNTSSSTQAAMIRRLQVLAVVGGDGDSGGLGGSGTSLGGGSDTPARAGRGVFAVLVARRGVGRDSSGRLSGSTSVEALGALELGRLLGVNSDGDGGGAEGSPMLAHVASQDKYI